MTAHEKDYVRDEFSFIMKGVTRAINKIKRDLEIVVKNLDENLPLIEAGNMPEYNEARNTIEKYNMALQKKIELLNKTEEQYNSLANRLVTGEINQNA